MNRHAAKIGRRILLEFWAVVMTAAIVGFLGPFGTYLDGDFASRAMRWFLLLVGAYILMRPTILLWRWMAGVTGLPRGSMVFWGVLLSSLPMAWLWRFVGGAEVQRLVGVTGMVPFSSLCALLIMAIARWAAQADAHLLRYYDISRRETPIVPVRDRSDHEIGHAPAYAAPFEDDRKPDIADPPPVGPRPDPLTMPSSPATRLRLRLKPSFIGDILALESEDHYVRVHGEGQSELLFLRLRDAIVEMDGVAGEQIHRSWWVARDAVARVAGNGRNREIELIGGLRAPVARDSVERLRTIGFLTDGRAMPDRVAGAIHRSGG